MKIFWTPEAELSFKNNLSYLEEKWTPRVILDYINDVDTVLRIISKSPEIFPIHNKEKGIRKCVLGKQITLFYRIKPMQIDLLSFWNNYQSRDKLKF